MTFLDLLDFLLLLLLLEDCWLFLITCLMHLLVIILCRILQWYTTYEEIPQYKLDGSVKFIRDQIDFRPAVKELRNGSGTGSASFYINC